MKPGIDIERDAMYPESDGQPLADNEVQLDQIVRLFTQLKHWFRGRDDVHVGADLLWYPVEGHPEVRRAPDVFVVPGRPAGPARRAWLQWQEDDVPMRHVVEILSPANTPAEMTDKRRFYDRYGVEEYLVFDPDTGSLDVHLRTDLGLVPLGVELPWRSDLLEGCQYRVDHGVPVVGDDVHALVLLDPDGQPFETLDDAVARADAQAARADQLAARLRDAGLD